MKKLLVVAIAAMVTTSAFAQKSMVRMYGWDSGSRASSFDFSTFSDDVDGSESSDMRIAINYAYAITNAFQIGLTYDSKKETTDGDVDAGSYTKTGLSFYYNMAKKVNDTCYLGLHYNMTSFADDDATIGSQDGNKNTDIVLEYGHRFAVGSAWGFDLAFSPAVMYTMTTKTPDTGDDVKETSLAWNFLKFDVLF
jgi:hypothetical protein